MEAEITAALVAQVIEGDTNSYYRNYHAERKELMRRYGEAQLDERLAVLRSHPEQIRDMFELDLLLRWQLIREGVYIWSGDASSCLAQILHTAILKIPSDVHEGK